MKTFVNPKSILVILSTTLFIGCGGGGSTSTANTLPTGGTGTSTGGGTATAQCRQIQPVLEKLNRSYSSKDTYNAYASTKGSSGKGSGGGSDSGKGSGGGSDSGKGSSGGSDSGKGSSGSGGSHNEGRNCLECHSFASAGTVFTSLNARNNTPGVAGYRIQLNNSVVFSTARGTGNSRGSSLPSGKFTAQVIDPSGNVVNSSASLSHDASRRACNSCHSASGNNGAPGRITSKRLASTGTATPTGATASACVSFNSNVMPILQAKCKSCHGSNGNFTVTSPNATHANISSLGAQYLLDKGSNTKGHGGGQVIAPASAEYTTLKAWISEGALNN